MKTFATALIATFVLGGAAQEWPKEVSIGDTWYTGTGCPENSVSTTVSAEKDVVTFGFDKFSASIGPKGGRSEKKSCQLRVALEHTVNYQLAVTQTTYHGYSRLDDGVKADFESEFFFKEDEGDSTKHHHSKMSLAGLENLKGKKFRVSQKHEKAKITWSTCRGQSVLNIVDRVSLSSRNKNATGVIAVDDATLSLTHEMSIQWRFCKDPKLVVGPKGLYVNGTDTE